MSFYDREVRVYSSTLHAMNVTLLKALVVSVPICVLFFWSVALFFRERTLCSVLELLGAGGLIVVILAYVSEAL